MASKTMKKIGIAHVSVKLLKEWINTLFEHIDTKFMYRFKSDEI